MAKQTSYNLRSVMAMGWVYARMGAGKFGGSPRLYIAAALKQAWAEEKELAAMDARRLATLAARRANNTVGAELEAMRPLRTGGYSFQRGTRTGRYQGGRL